MSELFFGAALMWLSTQRFRYDASTEIDYIPWRCAHIKAHTLTGQISLPTEHTQKNARVGAKEGMRCQHNRENNFEFGEPFVELQPMPDQRQHRNRIFYILMAN